MKMTNDVKTTLVDKFGSATYTTLKSVAVHGAAKHLQNDHYCSLWTAMIVEGRRT